MLGIGIETARVIGFAALFAVVYAILYKPVLGMMENRNHDEPGVDTPEDVGGGSPDAAAPSRPTPLYRDAVLLSAVVVVFAVDQLTKYVVKTNLDLYESWPREGLARITYGTNSGTAFGLFPNQTAALIVTSLLAIGFIYYFYRSHALPSRLLRLAIGLQLGGAFGNLVDRVRLGEVVDFIDIGWWPIFNIADSAIVTGIGLLALVVLLNPREEKSGADRAEPADAPPEAGRTAPSPDPRDDAHISG